MTRWSGLDLQNSKQLSFARNKHPRRKGLYNMELIDLPDKKLFTPSDVSRHLCISVATVYQWIDKGQLKAVRIGNKMIRIKRADVVEIISRFEPRDEYISSIGGVNG